MVTAGVFWIGSACLFVGAAAIIILGGIETTRQSARTVLHAAVCLIAAVLYVVLAAGTPRISIGPIEIGTRYVTWLLTTPLLLAALTVTAAPLGRTVVRWAATIVFLDLVVVLTRAIAEDQIGASVWVWLFISLVALVLLFALLWLPIREIAESGHPTRAELYQRHAGLLTVLFSLYPVAFALGPDLLAVSGRATVAAVYTILDIGLFVAYGLLVVLEGARLQALEAGGEDAVTRREPTARAREPALQHMLRERYAGSRARALELYDRGGKTTRVLWAAGRDGAARLSAAAGRHAAARSIRLDGRPARPADPDRTVAPVRKRRRRARPQLTSTPFGNLTKEDAVPVAIVAVALIIVARAGRPADDD